MIRFIIVLFCLLNTTPLWAQERLFYFTNDLANGSLLKNEKLQAIREHHHEIDIIAPQVFEVDAKGIIWGSIDPGLVALAKEFHIKLMPLVTFSGDGPDQFHEFLNNPAAVERAANDMLTLCKTYHFYGIQFDFENIHLHDKKAFTHFFELTAKKLHENQFTLSIAIVPRTSNVLFSHYDRWIYENWSGAYDYKSLAAAGDFITIMSYDQHTSLTTPGPIAALNWVEQTIQYLQKYIPAEKLSLGIPTYSGYWSTQRMAALQVPERYSFRSKESQISFADVSNLIAKFRPKIAWNPQWQSSYAMFDNRGQANYLFIEDAKSFKAKMALAKQYRLRGISVWKFGHEDPEVWNVISS